MTASRAWFALPALLMALTVALLLYTRPLDRLAASAPPVEELVFDSVKLKPGLIELGLRTDGSEPVRVAQVQVDGAYRTFTVKTERPAALLGYQKIEIPYPWISGESHHVSVITPTGIKFDHTIEVAQQTPTLDRNSLWLLATVGTLLGVVPVAIGLLSWPAIRSLGRAGLNFLLAVTVGLLAFLLFDTAREGLENASEIIGRLRGPALFWTIFALSALGLLMLGRTSNKPLEGMRLSAFIALGIGLHNFGEGLAVGAALATGSAALATFLVIGFTIHNVTEGIGIAAPIAEERPRLSQFAGLAMLAGFPAIIGTIAGTQALSPMWIVICFAIGAGAIFQVMVEVGLLIARRSAPASPLNASVAGGLSLGLAVMYVTALLV